MSINWVMTAPGSGGFIKLPNEQILFTSPPRTSLQLSTSSSYPAAQPFSKKSDGGVVYITNQRIVYLPTTPTPELQSFSSPILNLNDTYVRAPLFGSNYWIANVNPVPGGNIPPTNSSVELRLTFRDGGAFDFSTIFERIKESATQAYTVARESSRTGDVAAADLANVHLEQLPAYEPATEAESENESGDDGPRILSPVPVRPAAGQSIRPTARVPVGPDEPPPGYEEAQVQAVSSDLEQRLRVEVERGST